MDIKKPNLFKIATKELSQDAFFTWLLQWAAPDCQQFDSLLYECGNSLLSLLMTESSIYKSHKLLTLKAGRQWEGIDIYAEVFFEDNKKSLLILEDKVHASEHADQLNRYKEFAQNWAEQNGYDELICTYVKIGGEPQRIINEIESKGYKVYDRSMILKCLQQFNNSGNTLLDDFISHLTDLQKAYDSFQHTLPNNWDNAAWVGFYQFVESRIDINLWHWVNNPSGGFWNLCLTWGHWSNFPVYIQIEQGRLCFKIAVAEDETGWDLSDIEKRNAQDQVQQLLFDYASSVGMKDIERPYPYVHRGNYRTFAVISVDTWRGDANQPLQAENVIVKLNGYKKFYLAFIEFTKKVNIATPNFKEVLDI